MSKYALLIDITSIQKYVFSSSKLKENLGASYLISDLYHSLINQNEYVKDIPKTEGYIGGGNALFLFDTAYQAEEFVRKWTRSLLVNAPGITVASAINEWDESKFTESRKVLFDKLKESKSKFIAQTIIQRHGISAECQSDGYSMDVWSNSEEGYISAATNAKIIAFPESKKKTDEKFQDQLKTKYSFTDLLDELGQSRGSENHIAIVHIDGNSMGDRFKELQTLKETKQLSKDVENAIVDSFKILLDKITAEIESGKLNDYMNIKIEKGKPTKLPIRPIILGGDDVTFVCDGRLGIYYGKIFMEEFNKKYVSYGGPLSSCAGIAVIKTKYPFYKGYQLAEELCANAKSRRRELNDKGSWLDFHITYGGFSGSLEEIREKYYRAPLGSLIYRPYKISNPAVYSFDEFLINAKKLKKEWPNNKIKELREVLTLGEDAAKTFVNETKARNLQLPHVNGEKYEDNLFDSNKTKTPYFDMIELLEYYPKYLLEGEE